MPRNILSSETVYAFKTTLRPKDRSKKNQISAESKLAKALNSGSNVILISLFLQNVYDTVIICTET